MELALSRLREFFAIPADFSIYRLRGVLIAVVAMMFAVASSNYLIQFEINDWLTWGAFVYPLTFGITELTNRFYGPRTARRVVFAGFVVAVVLAFAFMNRRIALASSIAFLVGQLLDISVFNRFRRGSWWLAPGLASFSASAVDTGVFFTLAFAGEPIGWVQLALGDFGIKVLMDLMFLLPFRLMLWKNQSL